MKGIVINILENFISEKLGDETLEEIYEKVELSEGAPPFLGPVNYPDEDINNILFFLSKKTNSSIEELLHAFGIYLLPVFVAKYPVFFENIFQFTKGLFEGLRRVFDLAGQGLGRLTPAFGSPGKAVTRIDQAVGYFSAQ